MKLEEYPQLEITVPEFLNIGVACTSKHLGTVKENTIAMIIEDTKLGTSEITYKTLANASDRLANFLRSIEIDVRDRVLICLKNSLAYPISFFGTMKAGIVAVPTSTLLSGSEVKYLATDSQAKAIVLSASMYDNLLPYLENLDNLSHIIVAGIASVENLLQPKGIKIYALDAILENFDDSPNHYNSRSGEPAYLVYTSGTTGFPKGVLHSHRSLIGREPASEYWFDFKENDRIMHSGKFNWTYVLGSALMDPLYRGYTVIAHEGANDAKSWIELIKKHQCTIFIGVPTIYRQIIQKTDFTIEDCPSLRHCMSAGEHLSSEMVTLWQERFKQNIYEAIGMSEFSYYISHSKYRPIRPGSAGFVQPGHNVKLLDPNTLEEVGSEEEGMICIGEDDPGLFLEYWNLEEDTAKARHNGYFFTGDYAKRDKEGYIWFLGRKDDIINTFGFRVSPHEIERVIKTHPLVADCVALGLDLDAYKTIVAIVVIPKGAISKEDEAAILEFGQNNLAKYKAPKQIYIASDYPKTKNGKVLRKQLAKIVMGEEAVEIPKAETYRARRSMLFVPPYNERFIQKSRTLLADAIIFDMEGILEEQRVVARLMIQKEFAENSNFGTSERILRVNKLGTADLLEDIKLAKTIDIDALLFTCIESAADVLKVEEILETINPKLELMITIESPLGVLNIQQICATGGRLRCVMIGSNTLAQKLQINLKKNSKAIFNYMAQIVLAARAYGKIVIDGPHYDVSDEFSCEASSKDAYYLGCDGKAALHPIQLEYVNDIFTPKKAEVEDAKEMILAFEKAQKSGREVIQFKNELIDRSRIEWAQRIITLYDRYREIGQSLY
ncbi:MAG: aldolase/citrate lyase family protein [Sulfurospirillaceae bacterium]|jgi:acyl-coenzyme A synthetase/AMP-(fatty) acid ligase/citrate lyase beta subunit|nr:aldolase/citrate lyase family protein [Sulfurospirillaceae bacterium]MDD2825682.1 aldolase/citrate lyase family protein [Sulfurospirillaceae bacterium]